MDHAVVGDDVGDGDLGVVDEDAVVVDGHGDVLSEQCGGGSAIGEVGGQDLRADHVVEQDVGELRQCEEVFGRGVQGTGEAREGVIGWGEDGEGAFTGQGACEVGFDDGGFEDGCARRC